MARVVLALSRAQHGERPAAERDLQALSGARDDGIAIGRMHCLRWTISPTATLRPRALNRCRRSASRAASGSFGTAARSSRSPRLSASSARPTARSPGWRGSTHRPASWLEMHGSTDCAPTHAPRLAAADAWTVTGRPRECRNCPTSPPTSARSKTRILGRPLEARAHREPVPAAHRASRRSASVEGRVVRELRRIGKRIAIGLDGDLWLVLHLMIAGRLHWRAAGAKLAGRNALAAFDFPNGSLVLTEAGTKRRASLHVVAGEDALRCARSRRHRRVRQRSRRISRAR